MTSKTLSNLRRIFSMIINGADSSAKTYANNIQIKPNVQLEQGVIIQGSYPVLLEDNCVVKTAVCFDATKGPISIGAECVIGHDTQIISSGFGVIIGAGTVIGADNDLNAKNGGLIIGNKCNIGAHVTMRGEGKGINLSSECKIGLNSTLDALGGEIVFGERTWLGNNCVVVGTGQGIHVQSDCYFFYGVTIDAQGGSIVIDRFSSAGPYAIIYGHGGMTIGKHCAIAGQTVLIPANHRFDQLDIPIRDQGLTTVGISVGDDVWIGTQCVILDGAVIGNGCVIGAGAVVKGAFMDHSIIVGSLGRVIKMRT